MPMIWSPEANVKLLVGMLAQLKDQSVKLDYKKLAEHMGPECTTRSITNQFTKLKKQAAEAAEGMGRVDDADGQAQSEARAEAPVRAGRKRKRGSVSGKWATARKKEEGSG
ncbi:hypothetical protein BJX68DRAFT_261064 [Aspergillus pseudodeflectus]|uniref:Uncharacterized protein n=1 Tax=Aspergillus pseudodeflectus TaxID=176178 RepID=A0ABR4L6F5_9EURO